ncbi:MAG TPA: hypothetical protein VKZ76_06205 [Edaphocola sp.]|nr:hypothetical protein [Edaphocola sp.]
MNKGFLLLATFVSLLLLACNKPRITRDYTRGTLHLTSDSLNLDVAGRAVYVFDANVWQNNWDGIDTNGLIINLANAREMVMTDNKGTAVFENLEYTNPDTYSDTYRPMANLRFVTVYDYDDTLVQKVMPIVVTKGSDFRAVFNIDK